MTTTATKIIWAETRSRFDVDHLASPCGRLAVWEQPGHGYWTITLDGRPVRKVTAPNGEGRGIFRTQDAACKAAETLI